MMNEATEGRIKERREKAKRMVMKGIGRHEGKSEKPKKKRSKNM